jgi:hypothetical protein
VRSATESPVVVEVSKGPVQQTGGLQIDGLSDVNTGFHDRSRVAVFRSKCSGKCANGNSVVQSGQSQLHPEGKRGHSTFPGKGEGDIVLIRKSRMSPFVILDSQLFPLPSRGLVFPRGLGAVGLASSAPEGKRRASGGFPKTQETDAFRV